MIEAITSVSVEALPPIELVSGTPLTDRYIDAISRVMDGVSTQLPQFVGMTAFGSVSRGEARVKEDGTVSDFDGVAIIDAAKDSELTEFVTASDWQTKYAVINMTMPGMTAKVHLQDLIDHTAATGEQSDVDLLVVSATQLLDTPRLLLDQAAEPQSTVEQWSEVDPDVKRFLSYYIGRDRPAGLFFPVVYGEVSDFRKMVIELLAEARVDKPQIVSRAWSNIHTYVNHFQKGRNIQGSVIDLPETIDEAIEEYS